MCFMTLEKIWLGTKYILVKSNLPTFNLGSQQKIVYMVVTKLQIVEVHQKLYFLTYSKDNKRKVSFLTLNSKILKQTKTLLSHLWQSQLKKGYLLPELNAS